MTTTVTNAPDLFNTLYNRLRAFERSQTVIRNRMIAIRDGNLPNGRTPTKNLVEDRDRARDNLRDFLNNLTEDEQTTLVIAWGDRGWRSKYDALMDPIRDPHL